MASADRQRSRCRRFRARIFICLIPTQPALASKRHIAKAELVASGEPGICSASCASALKHHEVARDDRELTIAGAIQVRAGGFQGETS